MIRYFFVTMLCFALGWSVETSARPYSLMLSDKQLSSNLINSVYQDRDGIIWVATENGLNRYDGTKVTIYNKEDKPNSIAHNYIAYVYEDRQGNFIVGTYSGMQLYRRETDDFSEIAVFEDGRSMDFSPSHLTETQDGRIFSTGSQICEVKVEGDKLVLYDLDWKDKERITGRILEDRAGSLWTKLGDGPVARIHADGKMEMLPINEEYKFTNVLSDENANIYLQTDRQDLLRHDLETDSWHKVNKERISSSTIKCVFRMDDNNLLIGTDGNGIKQLNETTGEVSSYQVDLPYLSSNYLKVHQVMRDRDGDMWLALFLKGVARVPMQQSAFHYFGSQSVAADMIGFSSVSALCADSKGQMWVGTDGEGIYLLDKSFEHSKHLLATNEGGSVPAIVQALFEDSQGTIWVGSYDEGCGSIHPSTHQYTDRSRLFCREGNAVMRVYAFAEDKEKRLWIASMGNGLFCYDLKQQKIVQEMSFSTSINLWETSLLLTAGNHLLVGTYNGVFDINLNEAMPYPRQVFDRSIVFSLYEDANHHLWAAGASGVTQFTLDGTICKVLDSDKGLAGNVAYSVIGDNLQALWVGTNRGLSRYCPTDNSLTNYNDCDGLQGNEFSKNTCCTDHEGRLWFGGAYGINYFHPSQVRKDRKNLQGRVTALYINNEAISAKTLSGGVPIVEGAVYNATEFTLLHEDNSFSIELSTLGFDDPRLVRYLYSVNGGEWTMLPQGSHLVSFSGLHPGRYRICYKVVQNQFESPEKEIFITIRPYWWESVWAKICYVLLLLGIVILFFYQVHRHYATRRQMYIQKHAHEIDEAKLRFFTNITHEIRTPMTLIMSPLQKLMSTDQDPVRQQAYQTMQRNASMLLQLINQLLDIRKIDNNQMRLQFRETDIVHLLQELVEYFEPIAENKHIKFEFNHEKLDKQNVWVDPGYFNKIVVNLLSNAFKYTPNNGCVELGVAIDPLQKDGQQHIIITVSDNGIGIAPEERELIFDRFYRARNANLSAEGNGVGLHLTRSLVTLHHGTIQVSENENGKGSVFTVRLPLGNAHLASNEIVRVEVAEPAPSELQMTVPKVESEETKNVAPRTKYRLMVVDDDSEIRSYICRELAADFHIEECENGQQALQMIFKNKPDIVISDIMMPQVDGLSLCQRIKENTGLNHIPVILLTAKADQESNLAGLENGADAYITKPFYIEILRSTALNLVKSRAQLRNNYSGQQAQEERLKDLDMPSPDDKLLERIMRSVNDNLGNPDYSVDNLCVEVGISRVHLYRKLKELTNQAPRDFIRNMRLKQAARLLLKEDSYSVNEIAEAVGFTRPNNFSAAFKEQYGYPPLQWKAMRKSNEENSEEKNENSEEKTINT